MAAPKVETPAPAAPSVEAPPPPKVEAPAPKMEMPAPVPAVAVEQPPGAVSVAAPHGAPPVGVEMAPIIVAPPPTPVEPPAIIAEPTPPPVMREAILVEEPPPPAPIEPIVVAAPSPPAETAAPAFPSWSTSEPPAPPAPPAPPPLPPLPDIHDLPVEGLVERFESDWLHGRRPELDDYIPSRKENRDAVLARLVRVDLECRLRGGEAARVETYFARFTDLGHDPKQTLDLIARNAREEFSCLSRNADLPHHELVRGQLEHDKAALSGASHIFGSWDSRGEFG